MKIFLKGVAFATLIFFSFQKEQNVEDSLINDPRVMAFLDTIATIEGTFHENGYRTIYGGDLFDDFKDHPRLTVSKKYKNKVLKSTAAGRYQFLASTWDELADQIGAEDFSPKNQDKAAFFLIQSTGALANLLAGDLHLAAYKLSNIWSPFPNSPYHQPKFSLQRLQEIYKQRLLTYL